MRNPENCEMFGCRNDLMRITPLGTVGFSNFLFFFSRQLVAKKWQNINTDSKDGKAKNRSPKKENNFDVMYRICEVNPKFSINYDIRNVCVNLFNLSRLSLQPFENYYRYRNCFLRHVSICLALLPRNFMASILAIWSFVMLVSRIMN